MASYSLNEKAVTRARRLIDARQYVLRSEWGDVQPSAEDENAYLANHSWYEYAEWHLALTDGATFRITCDPPSDPSRPCTPRIGT